MKIKFVSVVTPPRKWLYVFLCVYTLLQNTRQRKCHALGDRLLLLKQKRMRFKPIKSRLFCWTGGQEQ